MPALEATDVYLTITWLGVVTHRREIEIETEPRKRLQLDWDGVVGAAHRGRTRASDSRVLQQHQRGTDIINVRHPQPHPNPIAGFDAALSQFLFRAAG